VDVSGGSSGLTFSGGPITSTGTISLASGALKPTYGGTGTSTAPANGQLLIGNNGNYTPAALTQGAGIIITNAAGAITIANAQAPYTGQNQFETNWPIGTTLLSFQCYFSSGANQMNGYVYVWNNNPAMFSAGGIVVSDQASASSGNRCAGQWALRGTFNSVTGTNSDLGSSILIYSTFALIQRIS
jgi:hypothetical protein